MGEHSEYEPPAGLWERWGQAEPIRRAMYPVAVAVVALLGGYGLLTDERGLLWLGVVGAVLSAGGGELARLTAWSPRSVGDTLAEARKDAFAAGVRAMAGRTPDQVATEVLEAYQPTREVPAIRPSPAPRDTPNV